MINELDFENLPTAYTPAQHQRREQQHQGNHSRGCET
jgi:hypothetical protein